MGFDELKSCVLKELCGRFKAGRLELRGQDLHEFMCDVTHFREAPRSPEEAASRRNQAGIFVAVLAQLVVEQILTVTGTDVVFGKNDPRFPNFGMRFRIMKHSPPDDAKHLELTRGRSEHPIDPEKLLLWVEHERSTHALKHRPDNTADIRATPKFPAQKNMPPAAVTILETLAAKSPLTGDELVKTAFGVSERDGRFNAGLGWLRNQKAVESGKGRGSRGYTLTEVGRKLLKELGQ